MPSPPANYCRQIEAYLCRKNDGHLIRIVGPAFDKVRGWEDRGIPIKIVLQGIDRTLERRAGSRMKPRRPVRIEFCEADVLDAFDAWRRAVGVVAAAGSVDPVDAGGPSADDETEVVLPVSLRRAAPLQRHIDRAMSRLTQRRLDPALPAHLSEAIDVALAALDGLRARAKGARGHARDEVPVGAGGDRCQLHPRGGRRSGTGPARAGRTRGPPRAPAFPGSDAGRRPVAGHRRGDGAAGQD